MKFGLRPYSDAQVETCCPSEPVPVTALVVFKAEMSGEKIVVPIRVLVLSRKWLMRYIEVDVSPELQDTTSVHNVQGVQGSPYLRLTAQSKAGSVTS